MAQASGNSGERRRRVVARIEANMRAFVHHLVAGHPPGGLRLLARSAHNTAFAHDGAIVHGGATVSVALTGRSAVRLARIFAVLAECHGLLRAGRGTSQRALYYTLVHLFARQAQCDAALRDACAALGVERRHLGVYTATRGVVAGCVSIVSPVNAAVAVDARYAGCNGWPIPGDLDEVAALRLAVHGRLLLVVEKYGVFTRLVQQRIWAHLPCVVVCGRGYPSIATRAFARRIQDEAAIPAYALTDCNPHGALIWLTYRQSSVHCTEGRNHIIRCSWIGLRPRQVLHLSEEHNMALDGQPLTPQDHSLLGTIRARVAALPGHEAQDADDDLDSFASSGKHELQWLYSHPGGMDYLSRRFIPRQIHAANQRLALRRT